LALETAFVVLELEEVENVYACNVARGCLHNCLYCYGPLHAHIKREDWPKIISPKIEPAEQIKKQLDKGLDPSPRGIFFSFLTDPLILPNLPSTLMALNAIKGYFTFGCPIRTATLSKAHVLNKFHYPDNRSGMTIVSLDDAFSATFETGVKPSPLERLARLRNSAYPWVSIEPYPPSEIHKQDFGEFIEHFKFVKLIVFGMWNYDLRSRTDRARAEYRDVVDALEDFCNMHKIRLHVKTDTRAFLQVQV
jgi:DNA repair photolyase